MQPSGVEVKSPTAFRIGFDRRDTRRLLDCWEGILTSERWSEGPWTARFEGLWTAWNGLPSVATSSWSGAALAALEFINVRNEDVLCPSNTFVATPLSVIRAGGRVVFVDCNRTDLCASYDDFVRKARECRPKAAWIVHIGGHLAFETQAIAEFCQKQGIWLLEDCAHAHGAEWNGKRPGAWGDAGIWSFYATKTITTGEGGMLVTRHPQMQSFARRFRNYGKPDDSVPGMNFRLSEFTAALGCIQVERMPQIVAWKQGYARGVLDPQYAKRVILPDGMQSGYYKYIVFDPPEPSTGKVYDRPCHEIFRHPVDLPNTEWVARNHGCVPIYYRGDEGP